MEESENTIESLLVRVEEYGRTNIDLFQLKCTKKAADIFSETFYRIILIIITLLLVVTLSIAGALFIGKILGENYYGFLVVAAFYFVALILLYSIKKSIKKSLKNKVVNSLLN